MKKSYTLTLDELDTLAEDIITNFPSGVVILRGDLAAGKTTLVKHIAKKLGVKEDVTSPTFSLQQCYGEKLFHYDIYNHGLEHFLSLGMLEELEKEGLHLIEWGDDALRELLLSAGMEVMEIAIKKTDANTREYTLCTY